MNDCGKKVVNLWWYVFSWRRRIGKFDIKLGNLYVADAHIEMLFIWYTERVNYLLLE